MIRHFFRARWKANSWIIRRLTGKERPSHTTVQRYIRDLYHKLNVIPGSEWWRHIGRVSLPAKEREIDNCLVGFDDCRRNSRPAMHSKVPSGVLFRVLAAVWGGIFPFNDAQRVECPDELRGNIECPQSRSNRYTENLRLSKRKWVQLTNLVSTVSPISGLRRRGGDDRLPTQTSNTSSALFGRHASASAPFSLWFFFFFFCNRWNRD